MGKMDVVEQMVDDSTKRVKRKKLRLEDLLAEMPPEPIELSEEERLWEQMAPVGLEVLPAEDDAPGLSTRPPTK